MKILYWERNGFCLWLKYLESERFKTSPDDPDEAIVLTVQKLNWLLDGFDLWRNRADSTTLGHSVHNHLDTRSMLTWTPGPRPLGQAVGAQRRRLALLV
ncbi:protein of unknown function [Pseudomonas mediterranea]